MAVAFGKTADEYARYRSGFPAALYDRLAAMKAFVAGQDVADLGTGTGTLARNLALRGCKVTGVDIADALLAEARRLDREAGVEVTYVLGAAERTGLPAGAFDLVTAGQCWHWFDRAAAAAEARRLLRPGGKLILTHIDWLPYPGNMVEMTEALIERYNPAQPKPHYRFSGATGIYTPWLMDMKLAGFEDMETFSFDLSIPFSHEGWRGRVRASQGVGAMLEPEQVQAFDQEHARLLAERFADPLQVPHRSFTVIGRAPAGP